MDIGAVLWDFGDTLCDERWMLSPMDGVPRWAEAWRSALDRDGLADRWNIGRVTSADVADALAQALHVSRHRVLAHMQECSRNITFHDVVLGLVAKLAFPQAIVTVNPDLFTQVVVPTYRLAARFDAIVTSWQEGTANKADLCQIALSRLPGAFKPQECLLIDNKRENVVAWERRGGRAVHFENGPALVDRWANLLPEPPSAISNPQ